MNHKAAPFLRFVISRPTSVCLVFQCQWTLVFHANAASFQWG